MQQHAPLLEEDCVVPPEFASPSTPPSFVGLSISRSCKTPELPDALPLPLVELVEVLVVVEAVFFAPRTSVTEGRMETFTGVA